MRIGVFGGSFDPVHHGHLALARQAADRLGLDLVRFVPARAQPLKAGSHHALPGQRAAMLELALCGEPRFRLDRRELERTGPSFTVDTLRALKADHPGGELFLLLGADAIREFSRWREAEEVSRLATVVVFPRPGVALPALPPGAVTIELEPVDVSATAVRTAAARGEPIDHLVPTPVAAYIAGHRLYRTGV